MSRVYSLFVQLYEYNKLVNNPLNMSASMKGKVVVVLGGTGMLFVMFPCRPDSISNEIWE